MEDFEKKYVDFLLMFAKGLSRRLLYDIINTPVCELDKFHFSLGLQVRNRMFGNQELMNVFIKMHDGGNPDELSAIFIENLKRHLIIEKAKIKQPL